MFIRKVYKTNPGSGKRYTYYRLVESYRGPGGKPRQRTILGLGNLIEGLDKSKHKLLADKIEILLQGQMGLFNEVIDAQVDRLAQQYYAEILQKGSYFAPPAIAVNKVSPPKEATDYARIDLNSIEHEDIREVGAVWMCLQILKETGIEGLLSQAGVSPEQLNHYMLAWIGRLVHPGSDKATAEWLNNYSGLCEVMGLRSSQVNRFHLYRACRSLYERKELIESHLVDVPETLFGLEETIILYDLTNTYFEGRMAGSKKAAHGRSKEKRSDAPLISLALVVDHLGFPKYSKFYKGNISEPETLADLLDHLEKKATPAKAKPYVIMDAGIATEANLKLLRELGYDYICVSRKKMKDYVVEQADPLELTSKQGYKIEVKDMASDKETQDRLIWVRSYPRIQKETAMRDKLHPRFIQDLEIVRAALSTKRGTKTSQKVHERIGRLKQKHARVAKDYRIEYTEDSQKGHITKIDWFYEPKNPENSEGIYFLRTSVKELPETMLWKIYNTLTEVEAAFRTLKTDLNIRPVYHRTDPNIEAHLFTGVLAYHIVAIIRYKLKQKGIKHSWKKIIQIMDSQKIITTTFNDDKGNRNFIRKCSRPGVEVRQIYDALKLKHQPFTRKKGVVTQLENRT